LYEELFFKGGHVVPTDHPKILRARDAESSEASPAAITALIDAARENRPSSHMRRLLAAVVPEYSGSGADAARAPQREGGVADDEYVEQSKTPPGVAEIAGRAVS
jgi:hypothetical protein